MSDPNFSGRNPRSTKSTAPNGIRSGDHGPLLRLIKDKRVAFLFVGAANTAFSTLLFIGLEIWFGKSVPSFVPLVIAWTISLVTVFFVYRLLVFKVTGHVFRDLSRFALVNLTALLINMVALSAASDWLGYPRIPSQLAITCFTVVLSYLGHKNFSFNRSPDELQKENDLSDHSKNPMKGSLEEDS